MSKEANVVSKKRILFCGEASPLMTGFSTYWREVLKRIHASGKFEMAEFGSYMATNDERASTIPWKFYGAMPDIVSVGGKKQLDPVQAREYQQDYKQNQFGKWKFEKVLADFKPDIVCDLRDAWMVDFQRKSPFRKFFKWVLMACVDGHPQKPEWISMYKNADALLTYSQYGKNVLEAEDLKIDGVASPGVDTGQFRPHPKKEVRAEWGLKEDEFIIGTVMRNQQRKLYPRLILAFKQLLKDLDAKYRKENRIPVKDRKFPRLLLHTSIPDVGWDIPLEVSRNGLQNHVLFTYVCAECKGCCIDKWRGEVSECGRCGKKTLKTPNTGNGLSNETFSKVYSCMDLYVQASVCEGWGMPIPEAKACGVPVLGIDWTAVAEQVRGPGGIPLKIETTFTDHGTMQRRALFSEKDFCKKVIEFMAKAPDTREAIGLEGRVSVGGTWDKAALAWIEVLDGLQVKDRAETWGAPPKIVADGLKKLDIPAGDKKSQIEWLYTNLLQDKVDSKGLEHWLKTEAPIQEIAKFFLKVAKKRDELEKLRCGVEEKAQTVITMLDPKDTFRIVYGMPETAGDVLLSTAVIDGIMNKWPHASVYFATKNQYASILKGNPHIKGIIPWSDQLYNYREAEGFADSIGNFDICFTPNIVTQKIPHWLHNGHGRHLMDTYADLCGVKAGRVHIGLEEVEGFNLAAGSFITVHTGSSLDIKNFSYFNDILYYVAVPIVQVGGESDPRVNCTIDLRGKTTPQQLAWIIKESALHIGVDSFPAHVAAAVSTDVLTLFGSTFSNLCMPIPHDCSGEVLGGDCDFVDSNVVCLKGKSFSVAVNPRHRGECSKPCHLAKCPMARKCIDYIRPYDDVVKVIREGFGGGHRHLLKGQD